MKDYITCTGMVLRSRPAGENDRLITLLTGTEGKVNDVRRMYDYQEPAWVAEAETAPQTNFGGF